MNCSVASVRKISSWEAYRAFDLLLEADLTAWLAAPGDEAAQGTLLEVLAAAVKQYVAMDPLGRDVSYVLPMVPMSPGRRRVLSRALRAGALGDYPLLRDYCSINRIRVASRKRRSTPAPAQAPQTAASQKPPDPSTCPRCATRLAEKSVQTHRDPVCDSWTTHRFWRCPQCCWRAMCEDGDSEWSHTPQIRRPEVDMSEEVRGYIAALLKKSRVSKRRLAEQIGELRAVLEQERAVDAAFGFSRRRYRALLPTEQALLIRALPAQPKQVTGGLAPYWKATLRAAAKAGWPDEALRSLLAEHPALVPESVVLPP